MKRKRRISLQTAENKEGHADEDKTDNENDHSFLCDGGDQGHRYGNFHNYYAFNPVRKRMVILEKPGGMLDHVAHHFWTVKSGDKMTGAATTDEAITFKYCDVGCNRGDLTLAVAKSLSGFLERYRGKDRRTVNLRATGLDLDPILVERARRKWQPQADCATSKSAGGKTVVDANFIVEDVLRMSSATTTVCDGGSTSPFSADLVSLFSTTMWIHVHGGDEGLRRVLAMLCRGARNFLLVEPQPSKCYRTAVARLRRIGRAGFDVSAERLKMRPNIEDEVECLLAEQSFGRVQLPPDDHGVISFSEAKTSWNRSLRLYQRIHEDGGELKQRRGSFAG